MGRPGFTSGVSTADDCAPIRATSNNAAAPAKPQRSSLIKITSEGSEIAREVFLLLFPSGYARGVKNGGE